MNNIFNPIYRQDYLQGYSNGLNPYLKILNNQNEAHKYGFYQGRLDYERMNGKVIYGIPKLIVTGLLVAGFVTVIGAEQFNFELSLSKGK